MFKFGNASLALIIPKKWIDKNRLDQSKPLNIFENNVGDLVISPREEQIKEREEIIAQSVSPAALARLVGLHYMFGTTKLRLYFKNGYGKSTANYITEKIKEECPGFEIVGHSANDIMIEDFNKMREADITKIISRLKLLVKQEFEEIRNGDLKSLEESERVINRFFMLGVRHVNALGTEESTKYFVVLQMLEMISDNLNIVYQPNMVRNMKILDMIEEQFDLCFSGFEGKRDSVEKSMALREEIYNSATKLKLDRLKIHALQEITNEISRISEFGLYLNMHK